MKIVENQKVKFLEGGEELKGVLLLLSEELHPFRPIPIKFQLGEGQREEVAEGCSKKSCDVIGAELP